MGLKASEYAVDEANAKLLKSWLTAGKWSIEQATLLFLEIDPDRTQGDCFATFSGHRSIQYEYYDDDDPSSRISYWVDDDGEPDYLTSEQRTLLNETRRTYKEIERNLNLHESAEPVEWICLACKKGITIPWLEWAIERKLYIPKQEADKTPPSDFDKVSVTYQPELAIDLQKGVGGTVAVSDSLVGLLKPERRPAAKSAQFTMKKAAIIAQHEHEWPTVVQDIKDAARNGLSAAAKADAREWREADAMEWARTKGKLTSIEKPGKALAGANSIFNSQTSHKQAFED